MTTRIARRHSNNLIRHPSLPAKGGNHRAYVLKRKAASWPRLLINDTPIDPGNDSHGERDFGVVDFKNHKVFWKIDYYANDGTFSFGSDEPWDASKTFRMMTIMLASEY